FALHPAAERLEELFAFPEDDAEDDLIPAALEVPVHRGARHPCFGRDVLQGRLRDAEAGEACLGRIDQAAARVVHRTRRVAAPGLSQHPGHRPSLGPHELRQYETRTTFCSMTDFADRYDDDIAR